MHKVITVGSKPIKMWVTDIEDGALEQAKNLANLPFVHKHIALMPDCHQGYGMPIGGVMATEGVIIPNAVGVDIGCFDNETEYLTPTGWKKFDSYDGSLVMQFDPETNIGSFVEPLRYVKEKCDTFIDFSTKYGINHVVSEDHRCLIYKYDRSYTFTDYAVVLAKDIADRHTKLKNGYRHRFLTAFNLDTSYGGVPITDEELRLLIMFAADGTIDKKQIAFRFKKHRKIERCEALLKNLQLPYSKTTNKNNITRFAIPSEGRLKGLHYLWGANRHQLEIIVDEIFHWDGNLKDRVFFTRVKEEADFIQYAISAINKRSSITTDYRESGVDYRVIMSDNIKVGINGTPKTDVKYIKSEDGFKYSFTVPTSFLVVRRNGNVIVTGNCGMLAAKTSAVVRNMTEEKIKNFMSGVRKQIPVGMKSHKEPQDWPGFDQAPNDKVVLDEIERAHYQIGTLGGGNHFIELQKDEHNCVWIMLHSGSRNFGYRIAKHYNNVAKELNQQWFSSVPEKHDLAFLPLDTEEGMNYQIAMEFAVEFALANRMRMLKRIEEILYNIGGFIVGRPVNIAHNYARMENHFGRNVMVHRKGATSAREGELGIIPGSQGTSSYIVSGLGNRDAFTSCSHGAGRVLARKQACRTLDLVAEQKRLDDLGVIHGIRTVDDLDEAPGAYKDIDVVMENQKDLVEIVQKLRPMAVIKG